MTMNTRYKIRTLLGSVMLIVLVSIATLVPAASGMNRIPNTFTTTATASPLPTLRYTFPVQLAANGKKNAKISYGKTHHDYPATDIFCPIGSRFVAPSGGVVDFVSREDVWSAKKDDAATRGGLSVAIVGDDGVRYYGSHLLAIADGIEVGVRVVAGDLLGLTGKSGNARATAPHLHFGISRPTTPDDWEVRRGEINPYPYLKSWQRGNNVTPTLDG